MRPLSVTLRLSFFFFFWFAKIIFDALKGNSDPRGQHYWGDPAKVTRIQNGISVPCEVIGEQTNTCIDSIYQGPR